MPRMAMQALFGMMAERNENMFAGQMEIAFNVRVPLTGPKRLDHRHHIHASAREAWFAKPHTRDQRNPWEHFHRVPPRRLLQ